MTGTERLVGAKAILRYLERQHDVVICRETLHRLRTKPAREFSCSDIVAGATRFPAAPVLDGLTVTLVADPAEVDLWVRAHRRTRQPD